MGAGSRAVEAAKAFSGTTINATFEADLVALLPKRVTGPKWEKLTGIKVNVIEIPFVELFPKTMIEHNAGTGAYDVLSISPAWVADLAAAGAIEPLDDYMTKYGADAELDDVNGPFRDWMTWGGKTYGLVVDGDVFVLFYRKDIFEDPDNQAAFKAAHGYDLAPPATWQQYEEICAFLTEKYKPQMYGCSALHGPDSHYLFAERFRNYGGKFFDPETMKATINSDIGVEALTDLVRVIQYMPPGAQTWGFGENLSALLNGEVAMTVNWPPVARWAQAVGTDEEALSWVPQSKVVDKIGYALPPGGHPELASGFLLAVSAESQNKDAAYLFIQWMYSKEQSIENVMQPIGLEDPFRYSHYDSADYKALWPTASDYLQVLGEGAENGLIDLSIHSSYRYLEALDRGLTAAVGGEDPQVALDQLASEWDEITEAVGVDKQRAAYSNWSSKSAAYPD